MLVDDLDHHLAEAGSIERAAVPMAMYLAWCANLQLLDADFQRMHEGPLLRLRYREISPAEFLTTTCGGRLSVSEFNSQGRHFTQAYYPDYLEDLRGIMNGEPYTAADDWETYDQIAAVLTRRLMRGAYSENRKSANRKSANRKSENRKWWQLWR
jgi:hypothetical protein